MGPVTSSTLTLDLLADWLRRFAAIIDENKTYLTELDSAIGDADHGANMARGTAAVVTHLDEATTIDGLLKKAGMTLVSTVGGTSGPLYGTLLMKMGMATGSVVELEPDQFGKALRAGRDATTPMVARKGRASYLGERSAGHCDPGATSSAYLFDALADVIGT